MGRSSDLRVAVIGAGIGGLTLAIALKQLGVQVEVFEQATELGEIGAAVFLAANGTRLLRRLGVEQKLTTATEPTQFQFRAGDSGKLIWSYPEGEQGLYREQCGAPCYGIHRKDLQQALLARLGREVVRLGCAAVAVSEGAEGATLAFASGETAFAHVVVGADGIHSALRRCVAGEGAKAVFSRDVGFRGLIPASRPPSLPDPGAIQFWMGPGGHLLHYAIDGGETINFLAVVDRQEWTARAWKLPADVADAVAAFEGWHPAVIEMVSAVEEDPAWWALHYYRPLDRWSAGRVVLIGDAAHAMLPHQGQGANQAIEDAIVIARLLAEIEPGDHRRAFARYETLRMKRTRRAQLYSRIPARYLHLTPGPRVERRNARIQRLPQDVAWLHTYDADQALAESAWVSGDPPWRE